MFNYVFLLFKICDSVLSHTSRTQIFRIYKFNEIIIIIIVFIYYNYYSYYSNNCYHLTLKLPTKAKLIRTYFYRIFTFTFFN